jgi:hypothetical protein
MSLPPATPRAPSSRERVAALWCAGLGLVGLFAWLFARQFPNALGLTGHDHALGLPDLLEGSHWFAENGLALRWFSPGGCGGVVRFASVIDGQFSLLQWLAYALDPVAAVQLSVAIFGALSLLGWFVLSRRVFGLASLSSLAMAVVFLFNDFFFYRMVIGHAGFHGFALVPWLIFFAARPVTQGIRQQAIDACSGALVLSYMFVSGLSSLVLPVCLGAALTACAHWALRPREFSLAIVVKNLTMGVLFIGCVLAKIVAVGSYMSHFPRTLYPLPGFSSSFNLAHTLLASLFFSPGHIVAKTSFTNVRWMQDRHEFEYGLTVVPLALIILGFVALVRRARHDQASVSTAQVVFSGLLAVGLAVPFALNVYTPEWNAVLKSIPVIGSASSNLRWFATYIPVVVALAGFAIAHTPWLRVHEGRVAGLTIMAVLAFKVGSDDDFYARQSFDPAPLIRASHALRAGIWQPSIRALSVSLDPTGKPTRTMNDNSDFIDGTSNMLCYEPTFGYALELLPIGPMRPGDVFDDVGGVFNMKNPACYVFPEENGCQPGDHFRLDQRPALEAFVNYRPFPFQKPRRQEIAEFVSLATLALCMGTLAIAGVWSWLQRHRG